MNALICNAERPEFMEPIPLYICLTATAEPEHCDTERWVAAQGAEEFERYDKYETEEPVYDDEEEHECFCNGCGDQLGYNDSHYCYDCVESMDHDYAERAMKQKKSCTSCGSKFKETPVGIRCQCELLTHGHYVAAGK